MKAGAETTVAAAEQPSDSNLPKQSFFEDPLTIRTILVSTDLSVASFRALKYAVPLAKRFGAKVHIIYVYNPDVPQLILLSEITRRLQHEAQTRALYSVSPNECHVRTGKPCHEITAVAEELDAGLVIIAKHGPRDFKRLTLGSTAEKLVHYSRCPVLVVPDGTKEPVKLESEGSVLRKILVPVDFSVCAKEAARYAAVFATRVGADLQLMHVIQPPDHVGSSEPNADSREMTHLVETALLQAEDKLDEMLNFLPLVNISAETEVAVGAPVSCLAERTAAPDIDLVITSTHGGGGGRHVLLGNVAEQLVRTARCPVLLVPSHCRQIPR